MIAAISIGFWKWENNNWAYVNSPQTTEVVTIKDAENKWVTIPRLTTSEARRTLGVCLAPDGNWDTEVEYLVSIAADWKVRMAAARLTHENATFSLRNVVLRKLCYPLTTTTFTKHQCHQIMTPILQQGLPKAGVVRTFPRALVHGPVDYSGLDIPNLFTEQMIAHVTTILHYGPDKQDPTGFLLHSTGKAMRLEVGYNGKLLAAPLILADNVTQSWIKHVWISTQEAGVTISTDFAEVQLQRQGDIELMKLFVQHGWKQPELHTLNQCRMFLQAFLVSDIISGSGNTITPEYWDRPIPCTSNRAWPRSHAPPKSAWALWKTALTSALHLGQN